MRVGIVLTCEKHLHDRIISLIGEVWEHETCLTLPFLLIKMSVPSQDNEPSYICMYARGIDCAPFYNFRY